MFPLYYLHIYMQIIHRKDLPEDYRYYRSSSEEYKQYLAKSGLKMLHLKNGQF